MAALALEQIWSMKDEYEADKRALLFLGLFENGQPLQDDQFKKWKLRHGLKAEEVKQAAEFAMQRGWILEESSGIYLTLEGQQKREG
jgi:hypothetical protein